MLLYYNTKTKQLGVSLVQLRAMHPTMSLAPDTKQVGDWVAYKTVVPPNREYSILTELPPKDGWQQWDLTYIHDKGNVLSSIYKEIDDACADAKADFDRFRAEYEQRERDATEYTAKSFSGLPGPMLRSFADRVGMPYANAAQLVTQQALQLRKIDASIADLRMAKYAIKATDTVPEMLAKRNDILAKVQEQAKLLK